MSNIIEEGKLEKVLTDITGTIPNTTTTIGGEIWSIGFRTAKIECRVDCNQNPKTPCPALSGEICKAGNTFILEGKPRNAPGTVYCGKVGFRGSLVEQVRPQADSLRQA